MDPTLKKAQPAASRGSTARNRNEFATGEQQPQKDNGAEHHTDTHNVDNRRPIIRAEARSSRAQAKNVSKKKRGPRGPNAITRISVIALFELDAKSTQKAVLEFYEIRKKISREMRPLGKHAKGNLPS